MKAKANVTDPNWSIFDWDFDNKSAPLVGKNNGRNLIVGNDNQVEE